MSKNKLSKEEIEKIKKEVIRDASPYSEGNLIIKAKKLREPAPPLEKLGVKASDVIKWVGPIPEDYQNYPSIPVKIRGGRFTDVVFDRVYKGYKYCAYVPNDVIKAEIFCKFFFNPATDRTEVIVNRDVAFVLPKAQAKQKIRQLKAIFLKRHRNSPEAYDIADHVVTVADVAAALGEGL